MFEETREGVMAIEAAVLPFRPVPSIHMRCRMTAAAARLGYKNKSVIAGTFIG
jgi:hypothetical protein